VSIFATALEQCVKGLFYCASNTPACAAIRIVRLPITIHGINLAARSHPRTGDFAMNTRTILLAVTAATAITSPLLSQAAQQPVGFDSCVKAFVATLTPKDAVAPKVRSAQYLDNTMSAAYSSSDLVMTARNPLDNSEVARAVCTVNARGNVIAITSQPM
jgi:hypothetical protein